MISKFGTRLIGWLLIYAIIASVIPVNGTALAAGGEQIEGTDELEYVYSFYKLANNGKMAQGVTDVATVTSFAYTTKGDPLEIWPDSSIATDPWHYVAHNATTYKYNNDSFPMALAVTAGGRDASVGKWIRYKINVGEDGLYTASNFLTFINSGAIARIFLAPEDATEPVDPKYSIGVVDTYATGTSNNVEKKLTTLPLESGNYYLTYKIIGYNSAVTTSFVALRYSSFKLVRISEDSRPEVNVSIEDVPSIPIGQDVVANFSMTTGDNSLLDLYGAEITAVSEDDNVATAIVVTSEDTLTRSLQITGVYSGTTNINVDIKLNNGDEVTLSVPVTVDPPGELALVEMQIEGIKTGRISNKTSRKITLEIFDEDGLVLPIESAFVTYRVEPGEVAQVTADGTLYSLEEGRAAVTAYVTVDGVEKTATCDIDVQASGENMLEGINSDFEGEYSAADWRWQCTYFKPSNADSIPQWGEVGTIPKDGNNENRAFSVVHNPNVIPNAATSSAVVLLKVNETSRLKLEPGRLYQFSFWMKIENLVSPDDKIFDVTVDLNAFDSPTATSPERKMARIYNMKHLYNYPDDYSDWVQVNVPVPAPTDLCDPLWVTPRIVIRIPGYSTIQNAGYGGTYWIDDIEFREVGFDRVEAVVSSRLEKFGDTCQVKLMPYVTTGSFISLLQDSITSVTTVTSTDEYIVTPSGVETVKIAGTEFDSTSSALYQPVFNVTARGKNGTAEIIGEINLGGEVRQAVIPFSFSGLPNIMREAFISPEADMLSPGERITSSLSAVRMDDTPVDLANAKVYYESSDINVAEVTDTGEIIAKSAGSAEISAYVEAEGVVCVGKCLIQVRDSSSLAGFTLGPDTLLLEPFSSSRLVPDGVMTSGYKADFSNADITYEIVESNPADTVAVADNGRITGIRAGHAKVRAKVNAAGTEHISNEVDIEVRARDDINRIVMDFVGYQATGNARSATLETDGWRINPDLSSAYVGGLSNGYLFQSFGFQAQVNSANTPRASDTAIDFLARKPGYYSFFFRGGNYANGALAAVYVNGRYMGQYDFNNNRAGVIYGTLAEMNSVYLEEGINSVIIRSIGTTDPSGTGFQHYPGLMAFHYLDELPGIDEVELSLTRARLAVGERTSYSTKVVTADGREVRFGNLLEGGDDPFCSQTVISNNPSVLRVNDDGTVSALSEGIAEITLTAVVGSETKTDSVDVIVDGTAATGINVELENSLLYSGDTSRILTSITLSDGRIIRGADVSYSFTGSNESVFKVTGDRITAVGVGSATLTATALFQGKTLTKTIGVTVTEDGFETVQLSAVNTILGEDSPGEQLIVTCLDNNGQIIDMSDAIISYGSDNEQAVTVNQNGWVTPVGVGSAYITAEVSIGSISRSGGMFVSVSRGKKASTFYTAEKVEAAHENISKYSWARTQMQSARNKADKYVDKAEQLWNMVTSQGIPRSIIAGLYADPEGTVCRYCGADLRNKYFVYPWITNPLTSPWKIQCPDCKRKFPSNDFAGFYELGLDEQRIFDVNRAHERNNELVEQGKPGYLKNMLYPEKGEGWGVDDGFGYKTGKVWANGVEEVHAYIAYYHHWGVWYRTSYASNAGLFLDALESLTNAYLFTGESKYGRTGAIVLDRIADVYPGFKISDYKEYSHANTYGDGLGRILGREWEPMLVKVFLGAYDAFFPVYDDPYVVRFLRDKAAEMGLVNDKSNPSKIRENIETNFIREVAKACKDKDIYSNFGTHQSAMALAALVLDSSPDTEEWMDWIMRAPLPQSTDAVSGGDVLPRILESVDRDGHGLEVSPGYNYGWLNSLLEIADAMEGYNDENANIYQHPRIRQMLISMLPLTINRRVTLPIGHSGRTASKRSLTPTIDTTMKGFLQTGDIRAAQLIYFLNGNSTKNLRAGIFTKDPENVANDIQKIIDEYGEYDFDRSEQLPAYGFSILRRGGLYESDTGDDDTQHSIYMTHGITLRHGNNDSLNIGIQAYGLELTPDLGYGVNTTDVSVKQWIDNTLSHNTVMVNQSMQSKLAANGNPMHFDDDGFVAVMDAETPKAYPLVVKDYRRTVVMVKANDEVSYGVDFFRVRGGDDHLYSFHAQSDEITDVKGLNLIEQPMGTYAGAAVPYGPDTTQPIGFSWLNHVRRSPAHGSNGFSVEFKIKDFNRALNKTQDIRLRMTMPAGLYLDEVSLARGYPPQRAENNSIPYFEYVLARRKGKDLDTLFTTTFEPYRDKPYLKDIEIVSAERISGKVQPGDEVRAVKVTHLSGRVDYIIYATNNTVLYRIADLFDFRGFVGVYSLDGDGNPIYSYIQDGDVLADTTAVAAATGKVYDFTKSLSLENSLTLTVDQQIDPEDLVGRFVCIENDGAENAVYEIIGAELAEDGKLLLDVGRASFVRSYVDRRNTDKGFVYNIAKNNRYRIPLSKSINDSPVFEKTSDKNVDANSELRFTVKATSPAGKELSYKALSLPRGASFDPANRAFKWVPQLSQQGIHYVTIEASDGSLQSAIKVRIYVHGATAPANKDKNSGQGGQNPTDGSPGLPGEPNHTPEPDTPIQTAHRFTDLDGYDWARDAIVDLAEQDIIKGTGMNTFSPAANIKRADFTVLLVRALKLDSNSAVNFDDVKASDYFANELAIAKANGIVTGIGGNRFNPGGEITRQDMMVIAARALEKAGLKLEAATQEDLELFKDASDISDYAKDAVAILTKNGIVKGVNGLINPSGKTTRAEVAVLIRRILDLLQ